MTFYAAHKKATLYSEISVRDLCYTSIRNLQQHMGAAATQSGGALLELM